MHIASLLLRISLKALAESFCIIHHIASCWVSWKVSVDRFVMITFVSVGV